MDTILHRLLIWTASVLKRAVARATAREPGGFEYLASAVLQAQLETLQGELCKQDKLLAETVEECDRAVAHAAALSRETIGLHLQLDDLRQRIPDVDILRRANVALAESEAKVAGLETALADSDRHAAAVERENVRLQAALTRAEAANEAARAQPAAAPILADDSRVSSPGPVAVDRELTPAPGGKAIRSRSAARTASVTGESGRTGKRVQEIAAHY